MPLTSRAISVAVALFVSGVAHAGDDREGRDPSWPADRQPGLALPVTARELVSAYRSNELKADAKYKGQVLRVSGRVFSVERSGKRVIIRIGEALRTVNTYVRPSAEADAAQLDKGQQITVEGWGAGLQASLFPKLEAAVVVR